MASPAPTIRATPPMTPPAMAPMLLFFPPPVSLFPPALPWGTPVTVVVGLAVSDWAVALELGSPMLDASTITEVAAAGKMATWRDDFS